MKALQRADKYLGALACTLLQPARLGRRLRAGRGASSSRARSGVLLIKFWGLGSLQLLTPAVAAVRRRHPGETVTLLTLSANRPFAEGLGVFDRVVCADVSSPSWLALFARIARLAAALRRERFAVVYDFEFFTRFSSVVTLLTGAPETHGFDSPSVWRGGFHTHRAPFNRYWHVARNFRSLAGGEDGFRIAAGDLAPLRFTEAARGRVAELLREGGLTPGEPYAVLNPNAGSLSLERRWPRPMFAELARRLAREERLAVVLIGSAGERDYTDEVRVLARGRTVNLAGRLDAGELAALLCDAALCVSNDSGPMHTAAALGTPTLGLFGPETPLMYAPVGLRTRSLYRPPPCSPCINVHDNKLASCAFGFPQCLVHLTVDEVFAEARALLRDEDLRVHELVPRASRELPADPEPAGS